MIKQRFTSLSYRALCDDYGLSPDRYWRRLNVLHSPIARADRRFYRRAGLLDQGYRLYDRLYGHFAKVDYLGDGSLMVTLQQARELDRGIVSEYEL